MNEGRVATDRRINGPYFGTQKGDLTMFSITRKPAQNAATPSSAALSEWDPFKVMEQLMRWEPLTEPLLVRRPDSSFVPRFDVKETKEAYLFKADLPGIKEDDVEIALTGNRLTVSGHRQSEEHKEGDNIFTLERSYGSFSRSFTLPDTADSEKIKAEMKDGVLSITLPKRTEAQPRKVSINK